MVRRIGRTAFAAWCCWSAVGVAQGTPNQLGTVYTAADYARAERLMDYNVDPLVYHTVKDPQWLPDGRFWYRDLGPGGATFMLVDPARQTSAPAFDHSQVAVALKALVAAGTLAVPSGP